ncbi:MAG: hydrogenase maturation nickel metallochaperone HypA [Pirellulaceae bacterium]
MSIVQALIEQVHVEVEQSDHAGRVLGLDLVIGRMSGVHVDSIRFAFEILTPGTIMEGADLRIREPTASLACHECGAEHNVDQLTLDCPFCGSDNILIQGGQDLLLHSIELMDEEAD